MRPARATSGVRLRRSQAPEAKDDSLRLRTRWLLPDSSGKTLRDTALEALRMAETASAKPCDGDLRGISLAGEDLKGINFSRYDLSEADLSHADLSGCDLKTSKLVGTMLCGANLRNTDLLGADLSGANLNETQARQCGLGKAVLRKATLFNADLRSATLSGAVLDGADLRTAKLEGARLRGADLRRTSLARADMRNVDLSECSVDGASFESADLRGSRLTGIRGYLKSRWVEADIRDADFCGAHLLRRFILDQNFLEEFRQQGRFSQFIYQIWWATSDCGRSFLRWGLWTAFLAVVFAGLYGLVDVDYGDYETALSPFYFSVVTLTTLGYGDVLPASPAAQVLAVMEVILGYVMLGGLLSIFASKMSRRAG